jgi:succinate dehydrogenase / fumarate reductase cytochrome b subunit
MIKKKSSARPLSPHLQIYRPQITSTLSIFHRFAGIATAFGLFLVVGWVFAAAFMDDFFLSVHDFFHTGFGQFILIGFTAALCYHIIAGLRHLAWDLGIGFNLKTVSITGWSSLFLTAAATAYIWRELWMGWVS